MRLDSKLSKSFLEFLVGQVLIVLTGILLDMVLILFVYQMSQNPWRMDESGIE